MSDDYNSNFNLKPLYLGALLFFASQGINAQNTNLQSKLPLTKSESKVKSFEIVNYIQSSKDSLVAKVENFFEIKLEDVKFHLTNSLPYSDEKNPTPMQYYDILKLIDVDTTFANYSSLKPKQENEKFANSTHPILEEVAAHELIHKFTDKIYSQLKSVNLLHQSHYKEQMQNETRNQFQAREKLQHLLWEGIAEYATEEMGLKKNYQIEAVIKPTKKNASLVNEKSITSGAKNFARYILASKGNLEEGIKEIFKLKLLDEQGFKLFRDRN